MATTETLKKRKGREAFTLIEILVVVAILVIITAIAIPALSSSKRDAELAEANGTAKVLNEARDRAILIEAGGIKSRQEWDETYGDNVTNAITFLHDQGLFTQQ